MAKLNTDDTWVDEIPAIGPLVCEFRCAAKPGQVTWEPGQIPLTTAWDRGVLRVTVPRLHIHGCVAIQAGRHRPLSRTFAGEPATFPAK